MNAPVIPFYAGILSVTVLFIISFIVGVFMRAVFLALKKSPAEKPTERKVKKKKKPKSPATIRSIEIDPEQVDRIYVKKVS